MVQFEEYALIGTIFFKVQCYARKITKKDDLLWLVHPNKPVFDIFSPRGYSLK